MNRALIPKPHPGGLDPESILEAFGFRMMYSVARDQYNATEIDFFQALAYTVRDRIMERWFATQDAYYQADVKRVYYLSAEFLLGRLLRNNIYNLGAADAFAAALNRVGLQLERLADEEADAGLGNGGLGRLAACFLDSASTLGLPFYGYGIRYEYGIFRQHIVDGQQAESPDPWLRYGNPWEVPRADVLFPVKFYGRSEFYTDKNGVGRFRWSDAQEVYAMAYDLAVPGYRNNTVNSLRLWAAKSSREFDLQKFNAGEYVAAVEDKNSSENISKVLYPPDDQYAGRELRLKQQYFFVSATIQDVIRRFKKRDRKWDELPDKVAIQLNDTHPSIAIPELMRVLVDLESLEWDPAWKISEAVFGYTNHTVLPEALETWSRDLVGRLLPRHLQIIDEIDRRFRAETSSKGVDQRAISRMAIVDDSRQAVRMANLAIVGSHSVNGVARLHSEILKNRVFTDFYALIPNKFNNKTNGVTPRRWLMQANPDLATFITDAIGDQWMKDLGRLADLEVCARSMDFRELWNEVKLGCKKKFVHWLQQTHGIPIDPDTLFDVQVKRVHEYKRQLLNVLHAIALAHRIMDGDDSVVPRTIIFGGKSAPGYAMAKLIIRLIHQTAVFIREHRRVSERINVVFVPNYDVSSAEVIFPATELSEQISTAGTEASGTGCMKAVLNGGVIIGTLDGANVEIRDAVGPENIFIFGNTTEQIANLTATGYDPRRFVDADPELGRVLARISSWGVYGPIVGSLMSGDRFFHCADFRSYVETQRTAASTWLQRAEWARRSILNTARSGTFSSDRTIAEYAKDIWDAKPVSVTL